MWWWCRPIGRPDPCWVMRIYAAAGVVIVAASAASEMIVVGRIAIDPQQGYTKSGCGAAPDDGARAAARLDKKRRHSLMFPRRVDRSRAVDGYVARWQFNGGNPVLR